MKQAIVLRTDLGMSEGKMIAQACHASLGSYRNADEGVRSEWEAEGGKKIALAVEGEERIMDLFRRARAESIPGYVVKDAGETELEPGTVTALGLGPERDGKLDKITKELELI